MCSRCKTVPAQWGYCLPCYRAWKAVWQTLPEPRKRPCPVCGGIIHQNRNRNAVYCSPKCRKRARYRSRRAALPEVTSETNRTTGVTA